MERMEIKTEFGSDQEESLFNSDLTSIRQNLLGERNSRIQDLYSDDEREDHEDSKKSKENKKKDLESDSDSEDVYGIPWEAFGLEDSEDDEELKYNLKIGSISVGDIDLDEIEEKYESKIDLNSMFTYEQDCHGLPLVSASSSSSDNDDDEDIDNGQGEIFYSTRNEKFNVDSYIKELTKSFEPNDPQCNKKNETMDTKLENLFDKLEVPKKLKREEEEAEFLLYVTELGQALGALNGFCHRINGDIDEALFKSQLLLERSEPYLRSSDSEEDEQENSEE